MKYMHLILVLVLSVSLSACGGGDKSLDADFEPDKPVEQLYNEAAAELDQKNYLRAFALFNEVERQHPYSQWATRAQLMAGYAAYEGASYQESILALDRFARLHPGHKDIDYAYYLRALNFYDQISDVGRDQEMTKLAKENFEAILRGYPNSKYARDARLKLDLTLDHLAGKEMNIGRYYLVRNQYHAAIKRFMTVVKKYQTTTHAPEALHRLVESYLSLGIKQEAERIAAVLGYNYPGSVWYEDTYKLMDDTARQRLLDDRGFIDKTIESLFRPE
ncbi:MAG: outer membrane protein assembly factor BamD [Alphaproteobacteria bacterium]|nr:MAG: outer membrane protein assembly factor BamD [Alphaproteobacteria bacterium]